MVETDHVDYRRNFKLKDYKSILKKVTGIYASACLRLLFDEKAPLSTKQIADKLGLSQSTVTTVVTGRLVKDALVSYKKYSKVSLTEKGEDTAKEHHRHHRLLEVFLVKELGISKEEACKEAERLMHSVSCETVNRICKKYDHPEQCPCQRTIYSSMQCQCEKK
ncbi:MAG: metal-dependent transcriptional regulator [Candidatus Odinarchaeota archaeon]